MIIKYYQPTQQPQFKEPTISRDERFLTVTNTEANGDYAHTVSVYADGELIATGSLRDGERTFNLLASALETERIFKIVSRVDATDEIRESNNSAVNEYGRLEAPTISIEGETLYISATDNAKTFDIYVDGEYETSVAGDSIAISSLLDSLIDAYTFTAVAQNASDNRWVSSALSNTERHINVQPLSTRRDNLCGGSVGDYILFAGGYIYNSGTEPTSLVEAYNSNLIRETATQLTKLQNECKSAKAGDYILFGAGRLGGNLDPYDENLTRLTAITLGYSKTYLEGVMTGTIGGYALFAGEKTLSTVFAVDENLTVTSATDLSAARGRGASANVGDYLLFAGGNYNNTNYYDTVDTYDKNLTKSTAETLTTGRVYLAGANVGGYALFAGGVASGNTLLDSVESYDSHLTKSTAENLTVPVKWFSAATTGEHAVFTGGAADSGYSNTANIYDTELVKTTKIISQARQNPAAASNKNYILFAGGYRGSNGATDAVDVFFFD